jgi:hypothetical protein
LNFDLLPIATSVPEKLLAKSKCLGATTVREEKHVFYRIGESKPTTSNVRIIAATNRDLLTAVIQIMESFQANSEPEA